MKTAALIITIIVRPGVFLFLCTRQKEPGAEAFWVIVQNPDTASDLKQYHNEIEK